MRGRESRGERGGVEHFGVVRGTLGVKVWGWCRWGSFLKSPFEARAFSKPLQVIHETSRRPKKTGRKRKMTHSARSEGSFFSSKTSFLLGLSRRIVDERGPSRGRVSVLIPSSPAIQDIAPLPFGTLPLRQSPKAPPLTRITMPRPMRTTGKRMFSKRSSTSAIGGRVATNFARATKTATSARKITQ
ncbi:hypothetical protein CAQUA_08405 [Corynebacterium aquatimens]|nr:hypothetical protein CAQUA_08405 [Corynebacterium aquatimens]